MASRFEGFLDEEILRHWTSALNLQLGTGPRINGRGLSYSSSAPGQRSSLSGALGGSSHQPMDLAGITLESLNDLPLVFSGGQPAVERLHRLAPISNSAGNLLLAVAHSVQLNKAYTHFNFIVFKYVFDKGKFKSCPPLFCSGYLDVL